MTVAEKNYDTSQNELLAIVKAVEHFKQFLYGKEFVIKTDHQPLTSIKTKAKPSVRLGRLLSDPKVLSIQRKADWLRNKDKKKNLKDCDEESNESGLPSYHTSPSPTSSSESEGDIIEYTASTPSQPRASGLRESRSLDLTLNQINRALGSFKIFNSQEYLRLKEQFGPEEINQPSRITDSGETTNKEE